MMRKWIFAAIGLTCAFAAAARAEDCKPLRYYTGVPITLANGALLVPATLNQKPAMVMFDSGGIANQLTRATAGGLKLKEYQSPLELYDVSGNVSRTYVQVEDFALGDIKVKNMQFQTSTLTSLSGANIAGLISSNFMHAFDIDLDFGAGRMNFFLPDHCAGKVVYWPATAVAEVPITLNDTHIKVPITVDGNTMVAIIDTGASRTTMNLEDAHRLFGLTPGEDGMTALDEHPNGDKSIPVYRHRFSTLSFGDVTVKNPLIDIMPDRVNSKANLLVPGGHTLRKDLALPEAIIGLDILRKLHVYIGYRERVLYIAPADDTAAKLLPPLAVPPASPPAQ